MKVLSTITLILPILGLIGCGGRTGTFAGGGQACIGYGLAPVANASNNSATCEELGGDANVTLSMNLVAQDKNKNGLVDESDRFIGQLNLTGQRGEKLQSKVFIGAVCGVDCLDAPSVSNTIASELPNLPASVASSLVGLSQSNYALNFRRTHPTGGLAYFFGAYRTSGGNPSQCFLENSPDDCRPMLTIAADGLNIGPGVGDEFVTIYYNYSGFYGLVTKGNLSLTSEVVSSGN